MAVAGMYVLTKSDCLKIRSLDLISRTQEFLNLVMKTCLQETKCEPCHKLGIIYKKLMQTFI